MNDLDADELLDGALDALVKMRPSEILAAEQGIQSMLHLPLTPAAVSKLRQVREAAMQSAHHWYMCSSIQRDVAGYSNDGLWTPRVCAPEVSVKG